MSSLSLLHVVCVLQNSCSEPRDHHGPDRQKQPFHSLCELLDAFFEQAQRSARWQHGLGRGEPYDPTTRSDVGGEERSFERGASWARAARSWAVTS